MYALQPNHIAMLCGLRVLPPAKPNRCYPSERLAFTPLPLISLDKAGQVVLIARDNFSTLRALAHHTRLPPHW